MAELPTPLTPPASGRRKPMTGQATNWAGNVTFGARRVHHPSSVQELRDLVGGGDRVRALGTGHSFSPIADTSGDLVSVVGLPRVMEIDTERMAVTVTAGVRYGELAAYLHAAGWALHNLGSLPHISIGGACATATHGSGDDNGNLASAVSALQMVTADGNLVALSRAGGDGSDGDTFAGAVVGLGALGIVTCLTLDIVPTFDMRQYVYDGLPRERLDRHWEEIFASGYSVSLFTDWTGPLINQVWLKRRLDERDGWTAQPSWLDARLADGPRHPVPGMPTEHCTEQLGVPGPWHTRLPHFRAEFTPSSGQELQSEYFVPRHQAVEALTAIERIRERVAAVLQISEIRTIAADDLWMSPSYHQDSVAIHFTWIDDQAAVSPVLAAVEEQLEPFNPRPHWGKLFTVDPATVAARYDRLADFRQLAAHFDPTGKFRNDMLDQYVTPLRFGGS